LAQVQVQEQLLSREVNNIPECGNKFLLQFFRKIITTEENPWKSSAQFFVGTRFLCEKLFVVSLLPMTGVPLSLWEYQYPHFPVHQLQVQWTVSQHLSYNKFYGAELHQQLQLQLQRVQVVQ
jgi:hypothetical protein